MIITNQRPEVKLLWKTAKKRYNLKSRQLFRIALKDEFLPLTAPFRTEADFLLNEAAANNLTTDEIKNSMSRGIDALQNRPLREPSILWSFFSRFSENELQKSSDIVEGDASWERTIAVYTVLNEVPFVSNDGRIDGARLVDDLLSKWDSLWNKKETYFLLALIADRCEPESPFGWFEGVLFLRDIERAALCGE